MRSKILFMFALIFGSAALNIITTNIPAALYAMDKTTEAHRKLFTIPQVGWMFLGFSIFWGVCALNKKLIDLGYATMMFVATFWGLLFILSWTMNGEWRAVYPAALYWLIAGVLSVTSSSVETVKTAAANHGVILPLLETKVEGDK